MKNLISPLEPFYCEWQGTVVKMQIRDFEISVEGDCLPEFTLKCWQVPIDNNEVEIYNQHKQTEDKDMECRIGFPRITYNPAEYKWESTTFDDNDLKEKKMSLAKAYKFNKKCDEDRRAIDLGALNEDGLLTCEGKDLLLNILLSDPKIREQFDKVLKELDEDKED